MAKRRPVAEEGIADPPTTLTGIFEPDEDASGFIVCPEPHPAMIDARTRYQVGPVLGHGGVGVVF